jgi:hypothetical protein
VATFQADFFLKQNILIDEFIHFHPQSIYPGYHNSLVLDAFFGVAEIDFQILAKIE